MTSVLAIVHQYITEKSMLHGVLDESCITIIASVDFFSYSKQPYGGYIHKRPEILKDMDELLNTDLAAEWVTTHTPYEIVVRVSADKIVYDGRNSDSEQEKVMNYLMKAYWCSFSDMENVILLKNDVEIQICDILNIRPFDMWR